MEDSSTHIQLITNVDISMESILGPFRFDNRFILQLPEMDEYSEFGGLIVCPRFGHGATNCILDLDCDLGGCGQ